MSSKIRILSEDMIVKIAAGEVVERPASVVKELIENSIDAGATSIVVDIRAGGMESIRVNDDGCGMSREDALLATERHATSKVQKEEDLYTIQTLGFRGEALPSIASISKMRLITRDSTSQLGTEVYREAGIKVRVTDTGSPVGTSVEVKNIFYNTPVRRRFLKSVGTEFFHIHRIADQMALSKPEIQFRLIHDGREVVNVPKSHDPLIRIEAILGRDIYEGLIPVEFQDETISLRGYIGRPTLSVSTAKSIFTYVNGRFVRDKTVNRSIFDAYRTLIPRDRYPIAILFIDLSPHRIDVNVHPTKREIRFRDQEKVYRSIQLALQSQLKAVPGDARISRAGETYWQEKGVSGGIREATGEYHPGEGEGFDRSFVFPEFSHDVQPGGFYSSLLPLGQIGGTYIVCQGPKGLVLLDQHAAHERVLFQRLKHQLGNAAVVRQILLFPHMVEVSNAEGHVLDVYKDELEKLGMEIEAFGGNTFVVKSVPQVVVGEGVESLVKDIIGELSSEGMALKGEAITERVLSIMACHGAIRANRILRQEEMRALLRDLEEIDFASTCPHGRPIFSEIDYPQLDKLFKRR
ncbi:MAG: DNA mismatch repair endonuclease MutL [Syntrophobacterales bacterium]|nr:MAG: DNA mismatch repair endonuclease MutL [Syntrophobacterales bacterium]